nr:PBP1A family penicillin-binding protein [Desulfoprunum benzoelyticum]
MIARIFEENRIVIPLAAMPDLLVKAFIAAEDNRFFDHQGLDFFSVFRAVVVNLRRGERGQGGSTITQQVARSLLLTPEKTYVRKFKEAILAWRIDTLLSKEEILYIYLNQIYLGAGAYGVEAASQAYFRKRAADLSLAEMAVLAGLPQAPSRYTPLGFPKRAVARQLYVLNRMAAAGYITPQQAREAYSSPITYHNPAAADELEENGYFIEAVKKKVARQVKMPLTRAGLRIYTTLDPGMQHEATVAVKDGVREIHARMVKGNGAKTPSPQAALASIEISSAKVRALVGGTDFSTSPFDRATQAKRQAGSSFKPLVYATALAIGWEPESSIDDSPFSLTGSNGVRWQPKNFGGKYHGTVTLAEALAHSYNSAAVRLLQAVGVKRVHDLARATGIASSLPPDLSLALGSADLTLLELTAAYMPYARQGRFSPPSLIERIEMPDGTVLPGDGGEIRQVLAVANAYKMRRMLEGVVRGGTGRRVAVLGGSIGGKTGTSNDNRDAWFIGFNERLLTGVWVGYDHNQSLGDGETGGRTAAPIWLAYTRSLPQSFW